MRLFVVYRLQVSLLKFTREKYAKPYRVYDIWKSNADYVTCYLLDQSCKRNKFLNHEAISSIESDIIYKMMQQNKETM